MVQGLSRAPDFTLTDIDGDTFSLSDYRGRVVLLEFMQTWCSRCIAEIPHDKEVQASYGSDLVILYISLWYGDTDDVLRRFRDEHDISWIVARGSARLHETYEVSATPTVYLIDPEGYIRYHHVSLIEASVLMEELRALVPVTLTITTSPSLEGVHFRVDDHDYYTVGGNVSVALGRGQHQVELVDLVIRGDEGVEYRFVHWSGGPTGTENPLLLYVSAPSTVETHFEVLDIAPPVANAGPDRSVYEGTVVTFDGSASTDNVETASYVWSFLDEGPHEVDETTFTYNFTRPGVYTVTLNVSDTAGNWATDVALVSVLGLPPPIADAGNDHIVPEDTPIPLRGEAVWDEQGVANYTWTFIDTTPQTLRGWNPTYTFAHPGIYPLTLTVTALNGTTATDTVTITVLDVTPPNASAGPDHAVPEDTAIAFDGSASTDNVEVIHYAWTFTDPLPQRLEGVNPTYTFTTPGTYVVTLTVSDGAGNSATDTFTLTVEDVTPPLVEAGRDQMVDLGTPVTFSAEHTMDNGEIVSYTWTFGDGVEATGVTSHHTYLDPGNYTVTLTVRDGAANLGTDGVTVTVLPKDAPQVFTVNRGGQPIPVVIHSGCHITESTFSEEDAALRFRVEDVVPMGAVCNVTIPLTLGDAYTVIVDDTRVLPLETRNSTHASLSFRVTPRTHTISVREAPSGLVNLSGLALIFTAGAFALLSPCGFPMLPGYISYYLGRHTSMERAVSGGVVCTFGLMAVFSVIGVLASSMAAVLSQYILFLELAAGVLAVILGIGMLLKVKLPLRLPISRAPSQKGLGGIFLYGVTYGLAILGCSAPLFFSTLFYAVASGGLLQGVITFLVYALGMGLPLILTTLLVAKAKKLLINNVLSAMPWFQKMSSLLLILIGIYLISYYHLNANGL